MSEFTEGPWCTGPYDPRFIFDSIGRNIAFLEVIDDDETLANARPIAAAPLMYEALRAMTADYDAAFLSDPEEFIMRHMPQVKAALNAAGGE